MTAINETKKSARYGWTVMRIFVGIVILTAAFMKAHQLATVPDLGTGLLHARWFNILVVDFELFFGIWLLAGLMPKLTWLASVGCFLVFASVSAYKGISGEASCGCFGAATINPWVTMLFDLVVVGALVVFRPQVIGFQLRSFFYELVEVKRYMRVGVVVAVWLFLAVPATYAMMSVVKNDLAELGTEFIGADGKKTILLEPEKWVGKEFPLIRYIEPPEVHQFQLCFNEMNRTGKDWNFLLYIKQDVLNVLRLLIK